MLLTSHTPKINRLSESNCPWATNFEGSRSGYFRHSIWYCIKKLSEVQAISCYSNRPPTSWCSQISSRSYFEIVEKISKAYFLSLRESPQAYGANHSESVTVKFANVFMQRNNLNLTNASIYWLCFQYWHINFLVLFKRVVWINLKTSQRNSSW